MELALAVMMALGIFVAIPAMIGFATVGIFLRKERLARKAEREKILNDVINALRFSAVETERDQLVEKEAYEEAQKTVEVR